METESKRPTRRSRGHERGSNTILVAIIAVAVLAALGFAIWSGSRTPPSPSAKVKGVAGLGHGSDAPFVTAPSNSSLTQGISSLPKDTLQPPPNPLKPRVLAILSLMQTESDPEKRERGLQDFLEGLALEDFPLALAVLTDPEFSARTKALRSKLFTIWGEREPRTAAAWISRMSPGHDRKEAAAAATTGYVNRDLEAAFAFVKTLSDPVDRQVSMLQVGYALAGKDPVRALTMGVGMDPSPERDQFLQHAANLWAALDAPEAVRWAGQISDSGMRQKLLGDILTQWSETDPSSAAATAIQSMEAGRQQNDTVVSIVQRWSQNDPETVASWVAAFPAGELRDTACQELVKLWSDRDAAKVGQWLNDLQDPAVKDVAIAAFVGQITPQAPQSAADWASRIVDQDRRERELEKLAQSWLATDPAAAKLWIGQSTLPDASKTRLLQP